MKRTATTLCAVLAIAASAVSAFAGVIRISQVYSGGGASTTPVTYKQDYVELFNASGSPVNIGGWTLAYGSATGNFSCTNCTFVLPANVIIQPCSYLLLGVGTAGTAGADFPIPADVTNSAGPNMSATAGKIAILSAGAPGASTCPGGTVEDEVSFGTATACEGTPTAALSKTTGDVRNNGGLDQSFNNVADFTIVSNPVPRNAASAPNTGCIATPVGPATWGLLKVMYR